MLQTLLKYINIILAIFLALSGFSYLVNPSLFALPAFLGLTYPFLLVVNIFFVLVWFLFFKKKRLAIISIVAIFLTWANFTSFFKISAASRTLDDISIMTWNVKNFDLYNWSNNTETHELMMKLLEEKKPDVLCLQEFYTETKGSFKNIKELKQRLGYKYYYFAETYSIKKGTKKWGLATFSNFPIANKNKLTFVEGSKLNACIYTDLKISRDTIIRVYNTHLQSIHFGDDDYDYLNELKEDKKPNVKSSLKIVKKLRTGFKKRSKQAILVKEHAKDSPYRNIICGDFNDTYSSYAYHVLSDNLQDAYNEKGLGFGNTLVNPFPFFRIDFVLMDKSFKVNSYETYLKNYSDHYPVQVYFDYK